MRGGEATQRDNQPMTECRRILFTDVRKSILGFVEKFNAQNTSDLNGC
jgi:hypothetical protein